MKVFQCWSRIVATWSAGRNWEHKKWRLLAKRKELKSTQKESEGYWQKEKKWKTHKKESESCWRKEKNCEVHNKKVKVKGTRKGKWKLLTKREKTLKYTIRKWNFVEKEKNWSIQKESETFWQKERNWEATKSKWKLLTKSKSDDQKVRNTHKSMEILQRNRSAVSNFYGRGKVKNILWNDLVKS